MRLKCGKTKRERLNLHWLACGRRADWLKKWHTVFAWLPVRVGPNDCRWLERVARRYPDARVAASWKYVEFHDGQEPDGSHYSVIRKGRAEYRALDEEGYIE